MTNYAPFDGDGRMKVHPIAPRPDTRPIAVSYGAARRTIDAFSQAGHSSHSGSGSTLWIVEAWCKHQGIPVTVEEQRHDGELLGYFAKRA